MFIIWSGWGICTLAIGFLGAFIAALLGRALGFPAAIAIGFGIAALGNYFLARWRNDPSRQRELVDPQSGETVVLKDRSTLFFIPIAAWTYIVLALLVVMEVMMLLGS
ncbi:hypothetical protein C8N35_10410 [Breoghania corrubedonensis]|uniref:Transmembrane protein n=1 Tax=Breoghania corrubedonensis TaxID=665038 RepID=A0A2T5V9F5_9HYPH|nr:hypothetical protein [Breoghania corrubedonensis]PTW60389.1 hypothetical protein C8N35_10410 [Breoghania corrubedonensis]